MLSHITNNSGIYKIISPSGKVYIGESVNIKKRLLKYLRLNCKQQNKLYNSFLKYGVINHTFEVIEECDINDLKCRERYWQDYYDVLGKNGLNLILTGYSEIKQTISEESIEKMKKTFKERGVSVGKNNPMYGKQHSEETIIKISKSRRGQYGGIKNPMYGKFGKNHPAYGNKPTKENLEKARENNLYGKNPMSKIVIDMQTGMFYESASELAELININKYTLRSKLNGHLKNNTNYKYC